MLLFLMTFLALPIIAYTFGVLFLLNMPWRSPVPHFLACGVTLWHQQYWLALIFGVIGAGLLYFDPEMVHARETNKREKQMKEYMAAREAELKERQQADASAMRQINADLERQQSEARQLRQQQIRALKDERRDLGLQVDALNKTIHKLLAMASDRPQVMQDVHKLNNQIVQLQLRRQKLARRIRKLSARRHESRESIIDLESFLSGIAFHK